MQCVFMCSVCRERNEIQINTVEGKIFESSEIKFSHKRFNFCIFYIKVKDFLTLEALIPHLSLTF